MSAFLKKEIDHYLLTNKWVIFLSIFITLGILNPFTAKITPALMGNLLGDEFLEMIGEPNAIDSWLQFFKNVPQLGLIAFILMMANTMSKELRDGTVEIFLAKGLKRRSVIFSKLIFHTLLWTFGYLLTIGITYLYTSYYWDQSIVHQLSLVLIGIYFFCLSFLFILFLGNTITNSTMGGLAFSGIYFIALVVMNMFSRTRWNPFVLLSEIPERLTSDIDFSYSEPLLVVGIVIMACTAASILHFNKRAF